MYGIVSSCDHAILRYLFLRQMQSVGFCIKIKILEHKVKNETLEILRLWIPNETHDLEVVGWKGSKRDS